MHRLLGAPCRLGKGAPPRSAGGPLRGGTTPSQCPDALPVAAPVAGQARVPSRAEQEAAKLPDDRDKLPVDLPEAVWGGQDARADVDSQVPEGCASTSGRGGDAVGVHERISPASVETRRPDRSIEETAHDPLAVMSQPTLWGHASRVPGRGWRGTPPLRSPREARAPLRRACSPSGGLVPIVADRARLGGSARAQCPCRTRSTFASTPPTAAATS